ncbi:hypothetical protein EJ06DRAFT_215987 [Trichodelitschia bisporula]|uniref:Uncharacterized protein n=1 Tax=Trichodelitschia bisporula TaxID=703511 RepID=A0A6G1I917_9PEZI|nr:hypothetical protein EJ06DRAFT_215987 [Trichodelitschia bisporula]
MRHTCATPPPDGPPSKLPQSPILLIFTTVQRPTSLPNPPNTPHSNPPKAECDPRGQRQPQQPRPQIAAADAKRRMRWWRDRRVGLTWRARQLAQEFHAPCRRGGCLLSGCSLHAAGLRLSPRSCVPALWTGVWVGELVGGTAKSASPELSALCAMVDEGFFYCATLVWFVRVTNRPALLNQWARRDGVGRVDAAADALSP